MFRHHNHPNPFFLDESQNLLGRIPYGNVFDIAWARTQISIANLIQLPFSHFLLPLANLVDMGPLRFPIPRLF
jgi:hypothetical protein